MIETCAAFGVEADRRDGHPGCWCDADGPAPRKIGALGHPRRARRQLPRDRPERRPGPRRLRPHRPVRHARPRLDVDRRGAASAGRARAARDRRGRVERAAELFAARLAEQLDAPTRLATRRAGAWPRRPDPMAAGLFELRKDPITGWWVATVVDRAFHRDRFARRGRAGRRRRRLPELPPAGRATASGCGRSRTSRSTSSARRRRPASSTATLAQVALSQARASGSWRTIVAPPGEHRPLHAVGNDDHRGPRRRRPGRDRGGPGGRPDRLPPGRPELGRPGRRADEPPVPRPVRPAADPASGRRGAGRRGAVRDPRGRVPVVPPRPRRDRGARSGSSGRTTRRVAFAPFASRSPFEVWVVPRRHEADFGRADRRRRRGHRRGAPPGARPARRQPRRPAVQPRPPHRAAARAGRRDVPLALGDPPAPARDRRPRARHRPAGEPGLARGRRRGAARADPAGVSDGDREATG